jgi:dienelactone hydrolase
MTTKNISLLIILVLFSFSNFFAQEKYYFREGLAVADVHRYGREALYTDALAQQLYQGLIKPAEGVALHNADGRPDARWQSIKGDSTGNFRGASMGNGYLYLTYDAPKSRTAVLVVTGHAMLYFNGVPHAGDMYRYGWMHIPVELKKGKNELYIRSSGMGRFAAISARIEFPEKQISLLTTDPTLPFLVEGETQRSLWAGMVVLNTGKQSINTLRVEVSIDGKTQVSNLPVVPDMMSRKVPVGIPVPENIKKGTNPLHVKLFNGNKLVDEKDFTITAVTKNEHASHTFISQIDGSVQYYAVAPQTIPTEKPALFFSVHGAEVEAISQARAYAPKAEGPLVAPTNRRPRGFNWEDWGRLDAMEVLDIAKQRYSPDPSRIYLTGHSMGGHGTWYLGATYAGQWAAIAPCAGYPTMADYGSHDGKVPTTATSPMQQMLVRAAHPGNTLKLAKNYKAAGVYIFHGDADPTVSVEYARQMKKVLAEFHPDFNYYEYPGGSHWFGNESVDWPPIFDYFRLHKIPASKEVNEIDFTTASVGISSTHHWIKILQQQKPYAFSNVQLKRNGKNKKIEGQTTNIERLQLDLSDFQQGDTVNIALDGSNLQQIVSKAIPLVLLSENGKWQKSGMSAASDKSEKRNGGFKEAFRNRMVFVYGTHGTAEENDWMKNKARYDAESWYYRGNGAVDLLADTEFDAKVYAGRGIVLFGNMSNNTAAAGLLSDCPVQVKTGSVKTGNDQLSGDDLGIYQVWPHPLNDFSSIALIGGTGIKGMRAAEANQYFAGGSGFPDYMIFSLDMLSKGEAGVKAAGYFSNQWKLENDRVHQNN